MLIHGFMGSPEDFNPIAKQLSAYFPCIAPSLKGHGHTHTEPTHFSPTAPAPYGLQAQAAHLEVALNQAGIDTVYTVGYSLGGRVALAWALGPDYSKLTNKAYNPRLKALCLTAAHVGLGPDPQARQARLAQDQKIAQRLNAIAPKNTTESWEEFLNFWYRFPLFGRLRQHADYTVLLQRRRAHNPRLLAEVVLQASNALQTDYRSELAQLAHVLPCLYVAGAEDPKYAAIATELAQAGVPAVLMPKVAHAIPVEDSARYGLLLQQFFASLRQELVD